MGRQVVLLSLLFVSCSVFGGFFSGKEQKAFYGTHENKALQGYNWPDALLPESAWKGQNNEMAESSNHPLLQSSMQEQTKLKPKPTAQEM